MIIIIIIIIIIINNNNNKTIVEKIIIIIMIKKKKKKKPIVEYPSFLSQTFTLNEFYYVHSVSIVQNGVRWTSTLQLIRDLCSITCKMNWVKRHIF